MPERHDTRTALHAVGDETRCPAHEGCMDRIYDKIAGAAKGMVSRGRFVWTVSILSAVAVVFGLALWGWTSQQCSAAQEVAGQVERRVIKLEAKIESIEDIAKENRAEIKEMRAEQKAQFERVVRLIQRSGDREP